MPRKDQAIVNIRYPSYFQDMVNWEKWRCVYEGGDDFVIDYLEKFTTRETDADFATRKKITPIPAFAKAAVNDIRNAIFQRMNDVVRKDGSYAYTQSVQGYNGGVDLRGSSMDAFMGYKVLTELLVMGRCGVYVDAPIVSGRTLADVGNAKPYFYMYPVEDICSWTLTKPGMEQEYQSILLKDVVVDYNDLSYFNIPVELPSGQLERYRLLYLDPETGFVNVMFFDTSGKQIDPITNEPAQIGPIQLELRKIPFVMLDIGESILKDVSQHQIALLNLGSSDVAYALKANFPFYTEQRDLRAVGDHLKHNSNPDGTATTGGQQAANREFQVGITQGRAYDLRAERPAFINPAAEPLEISIKLQEKLEDDIRKLVNLAVANKVGRPISAESKDMDNQGLEAGLSFIGLILENAERRLGEYWAGYEERQITKRQIPVVKYPVRYSLKSDGQRIEEAKKLADLMYSVPGRTVKQELAKGVVTSLFSGRVAVDSMEKMYKEIDSADYTTSDPEIIIQAQQAGLCGEQVASMALGFKPDEYIQAREDHAARIVRIAIAQTKGAAAEGGAPSEEGEDDTGDPGARGVPDLSANPNAGREEKAENADITMRDTTRKPVRGKGKGTKEEE